MVTVLKILFGAVLVFMCYQVINTSLQSNLFKEWNFLAAIPWMKATLWDFYANVLVLSVWICYKQNTLLSKIVWIILLVCLGSIATSAYVLVQLFKMRDGDSLTKLFTKNQ